MVGIERILAHLLQAAVHLEERLVHVGPHRELDGDRPLRVGAFGGELGGALHAFELLFLLDDDFLLNLFRTRPRPSGGDGERGRLHLRRELHRHAVKRNHPEQRHEQHRDGDLDRVVNKSVDEGHFYDSTAKDAKGREKKTGERE